MPVEPEEKKALKKINLMVFPGMILLKKPLYGDQKADGQSGEFLSPFEENTDSSSRQFQFSGEITCNLSIMEDGYEEKSMAGLFKVVLGRKGPGENKVN